MNIFISQTKGKSREVAKVLQSWLRDDMRIGDPWMSTDIPGGKEWKKEVSEALKNARFGILCITIDNLTNQWMMFEAGNLYFSGTPIFPLAIDLDKLRKIPSPLIDVQAQRPDEKGIRDLVFAINEALGKPLSSETLEKTFNSKWKKLSRRLENVLKITTADYEKVLKEFMDIIIIINDYRVSLNFSPMADMAIDLFINKKLKIEAIIETITELSYKLIEEERKKYVAESTLVGNIRDFFREHFNKDDLRNLLIGLTPILCSESPKDKKREDLSVQIKKEESAVYLRYHQELVNKLREHLP